MNVVPVCSVCMERVGSQRLTDHTACLVGTACATRVLVVCCRALLQGRVCVRSAGSRLVLLTFLKFLAVTTWQINNHRQQQQQQQQQKQQQQRQQLQDTVLRSEIPPEDLQIMHDVIGWGAAGVVRRGVLTFRGSQLRVSVKVLSAQDATPAEVFSAEQEIKSKAYAAQARSQVLGVKVFAHCTKDQQVCLVMLSHEDSLVTLVERGMSQRQKLQTAWQLAKAVQQLPDRHMLNPNIRPKTVLSNDIGDVVLSGMGTLHRIQTRSEPLLSSHGTGSSVSPGATQLNGSPSEKSADVWSLACTILYMFTQTSPFEDMTSIQIHDVLQAGRIPAIPDSLPLDLHRMLHQCFTWPCTRYTAALMALKLQAIIEDTSVYQAGDMTSDMPFPANPTCHQPNPALMTGGSAGEEVAALAGLVLKLSADGVSQLKASAAESIPMLALESQGNKNAIVAAGAVPPLVALLRSNQPDVRDQVAQTLCSLATGSQHNQKAVIAAGAVPSVLTLLRTEQPGVAVTAATIFLGLGPRENGMAIVAAGALPPLIILLKSDKPTLQRGAAAALHHLTSGSQETRDAITAAGALPLLVMLLRSPLPAVQVPAAGTLANLAYGSQRIGHDILVAGAVPLLVALLRSDQPPVQEAATIALTNLAIDFHHNQDAIIAAGALPLFAALLGEKQLEVQAAAADALALFAIGSQKARDAIFAAAAVALPPLKALLRSHQPPSVQEPAARALCRVAHDLKHSKDAARAAHAVRLFAVLSRLHSQGHNLSS